MSPRPHAAVVASTQVPTYEAMMKSMDNALKCDMIDSQTKYAVMHWMCEYGTLAHSWHVRMHQSLYDPGVVKQAGRAIGSLGGIVAMHGLFDTMLNFGPLASEPDAKYAVKRCQQYWDGIHGWKW